jgi:uncharacterized protein
MGAGENKKLIETMFAELSRGNGAGYLDRLADDVRFTIMGTTKFSGTFNGKDEVVQKLLTPLMSQLEGGLSITVDGMVAEGDTVVCRRAAVRRPRAASPTTTPTARCSALRAVR